MPGPVPRGRREKKSKTSGVGQSRRRYCYFCKEKIDEVDFKNYTTLRRMMSDKGRIRSRRITGTCRHHQVQVAAAIKRAREMALLPSAAS